MKATNNFTDKARRLFEYQGYVDVLIYPNRDYSMPIPMRIHNWSDIHPIIESPLDDIGLPN